MEHCWQKACHCSLQDFIGFKAVILKCLMFLSKCILQVKGVCAVLLLECNITRIFPGLKVEAYSRRSLNYVLLFLLLHFSWGICHAFSGVMSSVWFAKHLFYIQVTFCAQWQRVGLFFFWCGWGNMFAATLS